MTEEAAEGAQDPEEEALATWFEQITKLPLLFRLAHGVLCVAGGTAGLWEGLQLMRQHDVVEAVFGLLVVEPFSLFFLIGGLAVIAPGSVPVKWFATALHSIANRMWILAVLLAAGVVAMAGWWLWLVLSG